MYDEDYYRYRERTRDFHAEAVLLLRLLRIEPGCRVLEVGCGGGAFLARLEESGCEAVGVDLLEEAVRAAREMVREATVLRVDAVSLPFEDGSFDRLAAHHLVEHLDDLPGALHEWKRVLVPGGVMALCTPNRLYPNPGMFDDPGHVHIYDAGELGHTVGDSGFRVEKSMTVFPGLWKDRISVKVGVPLYPFFRRLPYYRDRGRSILLSAVKR